MFSVKIVDTDAFTEMPNDSQLLYFRLCLAADDDGFVSNPRKVMRSFGISEDSMKILIAKKFVLVLKYNDSAILLIKHWKMHNTIKNDRYTPSPYHELLQYVFLDQNKAYSLTPGEGKRPALPAYSDSGAQMDPNWNQNGSTDKNSIDKDLKENSVDQSIGKGDCKGENPRLLASCARVMTSYRKMGYAEEDAYKYAERFGISKESLDAYMKGEGMT